MRFLPVESVVRTSNVSHDLSTVGNAVDILKSAFGLKSNCEQDCSLEYPKCLHWVELTGVLSDDLESSPQ